MQDNAILGTLSIGGSSVLDDLKDVSMRFSPEHNETKGLKSFGKRRQLSKFGISWDITLFSTISADDVRVDFFNVTAFTLGGTDVRCDMYSFEVEGTFTRKPDPGFCTKWKKNSNKGKDYQITLEVGVSDAGYAALLVASASTVEADRRMALTMTINTVTFALPVTMGEVQYQVPDEDNQRVTFTVYGNAPSNGDPYPTTPVGTSTLLEWALNASKTTKAVLFKSNNTAAVGVSVSGNVTVASFKFGARDGEVFMSDYQIESYGTMTVVATT